MKKTSIHPFSLPSFSISPSLFPFAFPLLSLSIPLCFSCVSFSVLFLYPCLLPLSLSALSLSVSLLLLLCFLPMSALPLISLPTPCKKKRMKPNFHKASEPDVLFLSPRTWVSSFLYCYRSYAIYEGCEERGHRIHACSQEGARSHITKHHWGGPFGKKARLISSHLGDPGSHCLYIGSAPWWKPYK